jgi:anti-sigma regulatory factor (Ser/Thr protein kinase)
MSDRYELQVPGRTRHLGAVRSFFRVLVEENDEMRLDEAEISEIQLVLQEACINVIRHSGNEGYLDPVSVSFLVDSDRFVIEIHDRGVGFDPEAIPVPDADGLQEGGYGVFIMKQAMDRVETRRDRDGFVLSLTRYYRTPASAGGGKT